MGVAVGIDPNTVLSLILKEKPKSTLSDYLKFAGQYADTNFFMREIKEYNFGDTNVMDRFKAANAERDNLSKNLIIMQALESLMGLPAAYRAQIEEANKGLEQGLNWTMLQSEFFRVGDAYVRQYTNHLGKTERQILPAYPFFNLPDHFMKFPEIRSAEGKKFDMSNIDGLLSANLGSGELQTMVNLARNKIDSDFRTTYYDPRVRVDYESALAIGTGGLDHLSQSAHAFIADANYTTCWGKSVEECGNSALKAGYLVGDVSGGEFGKHHFISFYTILKKKQDYDRKKGASDKTKSRRKQGMGRLYEDMAQGYAVMENSLSNISIDKLRQDPVAFAEAQMQASAGMFAATFALPLSVMGVLADAVSELFGSHNDMERSLSKLHYQRNMKISKMSVNEQRKIAKYTERAAEADKIIDPLITVGATVAAVVVATASTVAGAAADVKTVGTSGGAGTVAGFFAGMSAAGKIMAGLAAYKAGRGLYEGGLAGAGLQIGAAVANKALAGSGNALLNKLSLSGSYNYNSGFSGGVGINTQGAQEFERRDGLNFGINYNEQTGFGTTTGMTTGFFNLGYGISGIGHSSGTYGSANMGFTTGDQGDYLRSSFDFNYNFRDNSFGGGVSLLQDFRGFDPNSTFIDTFSTALNWNSEAGFSNQIQYTLSNRGYDAIKRNVMDPMTGFMQGMANNFMEMMNGVGSAVSGMWRDGMSWLFGGRDRQEGSLIKSIENTKERFKNFFNKDHNGELWKFETDEERLFREYEDALSKQDGDYSFEFFMTNRTSRRMPNQNFSSSRYIPLTEHQRKAYQSHEAFLRNVNKQNIKAVNHILSKIETEGSLENLENHTKVNLIKALADYSKHSVDIIALKKSMEENYVNLDTYSTDSNSMDERISKVLEPAVQKIFEYKKYKIEVSGSTYEEATDSAEYSLIPRLQLNHVIRIPNNNGHIMRPIDELEMIYIRSRLYNMEKDYITQRGKPWGYVRSL